MSLSLAQRRARLKRRSGELEWWRIIDRSPVEGWTFEGAPIALGAAWPSAEGVQRLFARAELPADWPLEETRLKLDLGGESFVTLAYDDGGAESFGLDPNHRELPLKGRRFAISSESVARAPFGQPVGDPRLAEAALIHVDLAVERLLLLLTLDRRDGRGARRRGGFSPAARRRRGGAARARLAFIHSGVHCPHRALASAKNDLAIARARQPSAGLDRPRARQRRRSASRR